MSAFCTKRTSACAMQMSAFDPKRTFRRRLRPTLLPLDVLSLGVSNEAP